MSHDANIKRVEFKFDVWRIWWLNDLSGKRKWTFVPLRKGLPKRFGDELIVAVLDKKKIAFETTPLAGKGWNVFVAVGSDKVVVIDDAGWRMGATAHRDAAATRTYKIWFDSFTLNFLFINLTQRRGISNRTEQVTHRFR